jgi:hypothetical protein
VTDTKLGWLFNVSARNEGIMELRQCGVRAFERAVECADGGSYFIMGVGHGAELDVCVRSILGTVPFLRFDLGRVLLVSLTF